MHVKRLQNTTSLNTEALFKDQKNVPAVFHKVGQNTRACKQINEEDDDRLS